MTEIDIPSTYQTIKTKLESIVAKKHYTKTEINSQMANKANASHNHDDRYYTETEIDTELDNKQGKIYYITTTPVFSDYDEGDVVISSMTNALYYVTDSNLISFPNYVAVNSLLSAKADKNHASEGTTFGVGTTTNYGHNKIRDDLTASTLVNGESLSAHQGYVLKQLIDTKPNYSDLGNRNVYFVNTLPDFADADPTGLYITKNNDGVLSVYQWKNGESGLLGDYGDFEVVQTIYPSVSSIELVPKSSDSTGAIRLYYGDES